MRALTQALTLTSAAIRVTSLPANAGLPEALTTSAGRFAFSGPAYRYALTNDSVWHPLLVNMPGFQGARPVVNWSVNSDTPATWSILNDTNGAQAVVTDGAVQALQNVNSSATAYGPYVWGVVGHWGGAPAGPIHGAIPPGVIFAARMDVRSIGGGTGGNIYHRNLDSNYAPTESGNGTFTASGSYQTFSSTFSQAASYRGFGQRIHPAPAAVSTMNLARPMLEDLTGAKGALIPSEYVPSTASPGWAWFATAKGTSRTNPTNVATAAALSAQKDPAQASTVTGVLTESAGAALTGMQGLVIEPAATNFCQGHNTPGTRVGWAKVSGACTGYTGRPGVLSGDTTAVLEAPSHMLVSASDITLTTGTNVISSSTTNFVTAGINTVDTYWVWTNAATYGPLKFSSIGANAITSSVALSSFSSGTAVRIMRCPAASDQIRLELNNGTWHSTTVSGAVTLPTNTGTWNIKDPVLVTLAAAPAASGAYAASDNGRLVYFWGSHTDFGFALASGTGTFDVVYDRAALVDAGAGYLSPTGLVYAIRGAASGTTQFDFGVTGNGTVTRDTRSSLFIRRFSGSSSPFFVLKSHSGSLATSSAAYQRLAHAVTSLNTDSRISVSSQANTTVYFVGMQVEQAASSQTAVVSSPVITAGASTTRAQVTASGLWGGTAVNNIARSVSWTPPQSALAQKQVLWSLREDASNLLELSITNTTVTFTKRRGGTDYSVTVGSVSVVAGTPIAMSWAVSSSSGVTLTVAGNAATPNGDTADLPLTAAAVESIGGIAGASTAYGAFTALGVT